MFVAGLHEPQTSKKRSSSNARSLSRPSPRSKPVAVALRTVIVYFFVTTCPLQKLQPNLVSVMAQSEMSIDALLEAAHYLDEQEPTSRSRSRNHRSRSKKPTSYSRTTHNLLEKNRRAQLRDCLEVLRQHVPLPDKLTTLALLQSAKKYIEGLQQKEKDDIEAKMKLQHKQSVLLSRLAELGASHVKCLLSVKTHNPPSSPSPSLSPSYSNPDSLDSASSFGHDMTTKVKDQRSISLSDDLGCHDDDESVMIDIMTHDSVDETSSTTSGSDGGCTATTHKIQIAV